MSVSTTTRTAGRGVCWAETWASTPLKSSTVLTSNYSAEYGKTAGEVVNAITRSGTNQFHGSAYEFIRNSAVDARNFFDGPRSRPSSAINSAFRLADLFRKDKTFIFGDYESIRQSLGTTIPTSVLSTDARNGLNFENHQ